MRSTPRFASCEAADRAEPVDVPPGCCPRSELVPYRDADGKQLYGVLRYPVGLPEGQGSTRRSSRLYETFFDNGFNARAAFLANHGYAVFHPSVNLVVGRPGEAWVKGVTSAANRLIEMGVADPEKLGVHGTSYGGYATVLLITQTDRFKAAMNMSGKVEHGELLHRQPAAGRAQHARAGKEPGPHRRHAVGDPGALPRAFGDAARRPGEDAAAHASRGDQDPNVPASQSREIYYALRRLGKEVEWVRYVNGAHRPPNSVTEAVDFEQRIVAWYDGHLKGM